MNLFFKLLAVCGVGGSIGGVTYLSQQKYTNVHTGAVVEKEESKIEGEGVNVKKQPGEKAPTGEARQGQNGESSSSSSETAS